LRRSEIAIQIQENMLSKYQLTNAHNM